MFSTLTKPAIRYTFQASRIDLSRNCYNISIESLLPILLSNFKNIYGVNHTDPSQCLFHPIKKGQTLRLAYYICTFWLNKEFAHNMFSPHYHWKPL